MKVLAMIAVAMFLVGSGCASTPVVHVAQGVSWSKYQVLEVVPVENKTGKAEDSEVTAKLTQAIKSSLIDKGYTVTEEPAAHLNVLVVKSTLIAYEPGSAVVRWLAQPFAGKTQITLMTSLIDKKTGEEIADFLSADAVTGGGLYSVGADKWILGTVAQGVVKEIDQRMKGK